MKNKKFVVQVDAQGMSVPHFFSSRNAALREVRKLANWDFGPGATVLLNGKTKAVCFNS